MPYNNANKVVVELSEPFLSIYQIGLKTSMSRINFIFDSVQLLYYKCYKVNVKRDESYIGFPDWIKKIKQQKTQKITMINVFNTR